MVHLIYWITRLQRFVLPLSSSLVPLLYRDLTLPIAPSPPPPPNIPIVFSLNPAGGGAEDRDALRQERHKDRARERNLARAAPDKRNKLTREKERDISEKIALGVPGASNAGGDTQFDSRWWTVDELTLRLIHAANKSEKGSGCRIVPNERPGRLQNSYEKL